MADKVNVLGKKIRIARCLKGWTLEELSKESGVGMTTLCYLEKGKITGVTPRIAYAIAKSLDLSPKSLIKK